MLANQFIVKPIFVKAEAILINFFRQLTLPWLVSLLAMTLFIGLWSQYEAKAQQQLHLTRFAATLQLSIRPLLNSSDPQWLKAQLAHIGHNSGLGLTTIAVFDRQHQMLISTGPTDMVRPLGKNEQIDRFQLVSSDPYLIALQPVAEPAAANTSALRPLAQQYYIMLVVEQLPLSAAWLMPVLIVALIGGGVLLLFRLTVTQHQQRLHIDVSLLTHKLNQLRHGQLNVKVEEQLVGELTPLQDEINALASAQASMQQQLQNQQQLQQQQLEALQHEQAQTKAQTALIQQQRSQQLQQLQLLGQNIQQLLEQNLCADELTWQLNAQLFLLQHTSANTTAESINLAQFLAAQVPQLQAQLANRNVSLQLFEAADNCRYNVECCAHTLAILLQALLRLGCRSNEVSEISLYVQLNAEQRQLQLTLICDGDGLSRAVRQKLMQDTATMQPWQDVDIAIVASARQDLAGDISVQSLDGLGCTLQVKLALTAISPQEAVMLQHVLLFDNQPARLKERAASLSALTGYLASCNDLADLQRKVSLHQYDAAIIFLPEEGSAPAEPQRWQAIMQMLNRCQRVLCYASAQTCATWQQLLQLPVSIGPFCLQQLTQTLPPGAEVPKLLVVDDNATNLAFIRVLLQHQTLQLETAVTGAEAIALCAHQRFDLILLDIQLPDIAGTEVARQLRQQPEYQQTPILAFTAHALDAEIEQFLQAGMNDVIIKPLSADNLKQIMRWCQSARKTDSRT